MRAMPLRIPNLGLAYQGDGRCAAALEAFTRAYALAPDLPDLVKNLTRVHIELGSTTRRCACSTQCSGGARMMSSIEMPRPGAAENASP